MSLLDIIWRFLMLPSMGLAALYRLIIELRALLREM